MYRLPVQEARSPKSGCWQDWLLLRAVRESVPSLSPGFWWFSGDLWCFLAYKHYPDLCPRLHRRYPYVHVCLQISLFYKDTICIRLESTLMASFHLDYLCKDPISNSGHILRYWGLGLQHMNLGDTIEPLTWTKRYQTGCLCFPFIHPPLLATEV